MKLLGPRHYNPSVIVLLAMFNQAPTIGLFPIFPIANIFIDAYLVINTNTFQNASLVANNYFFPKLSRGDFF